MTEQKVNFKSTVVHDSRLFALLVLTLIVHVQVLSNDFHTDDFLILKLMRDGFDWQAFKSMENPYNFRPLMNLIVYARYHLFGENPAWWYLLNIILHLIATTQVYLFLKRKLNADSAFFGGLFFGLYFAHFEAIIWLYGIVRLVSSILVLAVWSMLDKDGKSSKKKCCIAPVIVYFASLFCVEDMILLLPFFMFLAQDRENKIASKFRAIVGFVVAAAVYFVLRWILMGKIINGSEQYYPGIHILSNIFHYVGWLILPQFDHPYLLPFIHKYAAFALPVITPLNIVVFVAFLVVAGVIVWRGSKLEKTALLFIIISLLPALPLDAKVCSKLLYIPSVGLAFLVGSLVNRITKNSNLIWKKALIGLAVFYFATQALAINLTINYYRSQQKISAMILKRIEELGIDLNDYSYVIVDNAPGRTRPWTPFRLLYGFKGEVRARNQAPERQIDLDSLMVELEKQKIDYIFIDCNNAVPAIAKIYRPANNILGDSLNKID